MHVHSSICASTSTADTNGAACIHLPAYHIHKWSYIRVLARYFHNQALKHAAVWIQTNPQGSKQIARFIPFLKISFLEYMGWSRRSQINSRVPRHQFIESNNILFGHSPALSRSPHRQFYFVMGTIRFSSTPAAVSLETIQALFSRIVKVSFLHLNLWW